jgi:hypothetical protein
MDQDTKDELQELINFIHDEEFSPVEVNTLLQFANMLRENKATRYIPRGMALGMQQFYRTLTEENANDR